MNNNILLCSGFNLERAGGFVLITNDEDILYIPLFASEK
jgi:hypothetical protein